MKKTFLAALAMGIMVVGLTGLATAAPITVVNGGFETGDLTGWTTTGSGSASVVTSDAGFLPTEGSYFANLYASSTLEQAVSWNAGDTLTFNWNFNANDYLPFNDYSIFQVSGSELFNYTLADVSSVGNYNATGWNSYTYNFVNSGAGLISFGVYNVGDTGLPSQLYVDNVNGGNAVPEPASMLLMGTGLAGLMGIGARRKMRK